MSTRVTSSNEQSDVYDLTLVSERKGFVLGVASAITTYLSLVVHPTNESYKDAASMANDAGLSFNDFVNAGCDDFGMRFIKKIIGKLNKKS